MKYRVDFAETTRFGQPRSINQLSQERLACDQAL